MSYGDEGERAFTFSRPSFLPSDWLSEFNHGKGLSPASQHSCHWQQRGPGQGRRLQAGLISLGCQVTQSVNQSVRHCMTMMAPHCAPICRLPRPAALCMRCDGGGGGGRKVRNSMSHNWSIGRGLMENAAAAATQVQASINSAQLNGQGSEGGPKMIRMGRKDFS